MIQSIKNSFLKFVFKAYSFFLKPSKKSNEITNIAIFSTTGLGDSLWATPALRSIRKSFPNAKITGLLSPVGKEVLLHDPNLDDIIVYSLYSFFSLFFRLKKKKFDAILIFHASQRKIFALAKLLQPNYLIGTFGRSKDLDFIYNYPIKSNPHEHEIERRLNIAYALGAKPQEDLSLSIVLTEQEKKEADFFLKTMQVTTNDSIIGIHPGSKDLYKRWPKEYFEYVAKKITFHPNTKIIITGSMTESKLVKSISKEIPGSIPLFGQVSLRTMIAIINRCSLFITNDTGPMHIAYALKIPTIAIFGPTHPENCGPYHAKKVIIEHAKRCCTPCLHKKCRDPFCLRQIGKDTVVQHSLSILNPSPEIL